MLADLVLHVAGLLHGDGGGPVVDLLFGIGVVGLIYLGWFIAMRRSENPIGWLLLAGGVSFSDGWWANAYVLFATRYGLAGRDLVLAVTDFLWILPIGLMVIFVGLLFPTGRLLSPRWKWVARAAAAALVMAYVSNTIATSPSDYHVRGAVNPLRPGGALLATFTVLSSSLVAVPVFAAVAVVALVLRYRRGDVEARHQIRVVMYGMALFAVAMGVGLGVQVWTGQAPPPWLQVVSLVGIFSVPFGAGIAVLKYRLYDIDVVISRTLVYGTLAAFITAVYVGIVVGVGSLVGSGGKPNLALSILATAVVAIGFQPVRERIQKVANRLVYGKRATPYEVLSQFSNHVAESYASDEVLPRMAQVLADGTGAVSARVWLRSGEVLRSAAIWPASPDHRGPDFVLPLTAQIMPDIPDADRVVAVRHQGELLGALTVKKRAGESLTPIEETLLEDLAHQAGLVLKNVGLTAELLRRLEELRASRQRLVAAQDEERRRLERDLHDGAQQSLVALKVKLGLVEMTVVKDPPRAQQLLAELKNLADQSLETLRDLARGIYPPLLADKGLAVALEAQARKASVPVHVEAAEVGRYPQEVEAAVYFCVLEALQNVQKYAGEARASVTLVASGSDLTFTVHDDGGGFDAGSIKPGAGLTNIRDRIDAFGGRLNISSVLGQGTVVTGVVRAVPGGNMSTEPADFQAGHFPLTAGRFTEASWNV